MKTVFILFETDNWKSRSSRVLLGVFETKEKAIDAAKENDCYRHDCEVDIVECELNKFEEQ